MGFAGPAAQASDFQSLSPQKPSPSHGFQAELSPHITRAHVGASRWNAEQKYQEFPTYGERCKVSLIKETQTQNTHTSRARLND